MIKISNLTKKFDKFVAVNNLSLDLNPGDIVGFLGPNGAGKSTTMKMITGFLTPTSGSVHIDGLDLKHQPIAVKQKIGYLPEGAPCYGDMTVSAFLDFIADIRGLTGEKKSSRLRQVIESVELESVLDKNIELLSKGFKRRVGLAQAIIHDPQVLILDEPTDGLDPNQKQHVRDLIKNLSKDKIVVISTHILEEVTACCNRAVIVSQGQKLFDGTPEQLAAQSQDHRSVKIEFNQVPEDIEQLYKLEGVKSVNTQGNLLWVYPEKEQSNLYQQIYQLSVQHNWPVTSMVLVEGQLDAVFRELTVGEAA